MNICKNYSTKTYSKISRASSFRCIEIAGWMDDDEVQDDPKLLDYGGEIPKSQGKGWLFGSRL